MSECSSWSWPRSCRWATIRFDCCHPFYCYFGFLCWFCWILLITSHDRELRKLSTRVIRSLDLYGRGKEKCLREVRMRSCRKVSHLFFASPANFQFCKLILWSLVDDDDTSSYEELTIWFERMRIMNDFFSIKSSQWIFFEFFPKLPRKLSGAFSFQKVKTTHGLMPSYNVWIELTSFLDERLSASDDTMGCKCCRTRSVVAGANICHY